jgi:ERCC4 domain
MVPRPKVAIKSKCSCNQVLLDRLAEKRYQLGDGSHFQLVLKRAMTSVATYTEPILSYKHALTLKHVGTTSALIMFPPTLCDNSTRSNKHTNGDNDNDDNNDNNNINTTTAPSHKSKKRKVVSVKEKSKSDFTKTKTKTTAGATAAVSTSTNDVIETNSTVGTNATAKRICGVTKRAISKKQTDYYDAVQNAEKKLYYHKGYCWRVVLLVDGREHKCNHVQAKCRMSGIPCEERNLPIGDMAWIAQGYDPNKRGTVLVELMLGTIIERKSLEDLKSSIYGTRYYEQRLRMKHCGIQQLI